MTRVLGVVLSILALGLMIILLLPQQSSLTREIPLLKNLIHRREVIGFLPYWLIDKADVDYSAYINNLTYFSLTLTDTGAIQKFTKPGESEPGYHTLTSGKADAVLNVAKQKDLTLSLAVFCADDTDIATLLSQPQASALTLLADITPLMQQYGFSELNLDIEQVSPASEAGRTAFVQFVQTVAANRDPNIIKSLSVDVMATSFIKADNLADPAALAPLVDKLVIMAYDFHYRGSYVTGPVAPGGGAGIISEFDTQAAIETALAVVPPSKIILGIPAYGYEWETISPATRSAVITGTGLTISNDRAETLLAECASCSAVFDELDQESNFVYLDQQTGTYHQIFFPDKQATAAKVGLAKKYSLGGLAIWALGYEGQTILEPLSGYRN